MAGTLVEIMRGGSSLQFSGECRVALYALSAAQSAAGGGKTGGGATGEIGACGTTGIAVPNGRCRNRQGMGANLPNRGAKTVLSGLLNTQVTVYYSLISRVIIRGRSMSTKSESDGV